MSSIKSLTAEEQEILELINREVIEERKMWDRILRGLDKIVKRNAQPDFPPSETIKE